MKFRVELLKFFVVLKLSYRRCLRRVWIVRPALFCRYHYYRLTESELWFARKRGTLIVNWLFVNLTVYSVSILFYTGFSFFVFLQFNCCFIILFIASVDTWKLSLPLDATQSAVLCLSVRPSVTLRYRDNVGSGIVIKFKMAGRHLGIFEC